jgi:MSHA biogenesis protein MshP
MTQRPPAPSTRPSARALQQGFGVIAALVVLVLLAGLAAAVVRIGSGQQMAAAQGLEASRATWAAASGIEWAAYQALKGGWSNCSGQTQTLDLSADLGMRVTVSCSSLAYSEGETSPGAPQTVRTYTLTATACNAPTTCPDNTRAVQPGYVERVRQATLVN